ncbi:MAG TPA: hypothetical protein VF698_11295, partial [Thermoanaerobaculia bacterium]
MQRGTSLTREEVSRIFQLAPHIVDALIDEGLLLCQVRKGEQLIPLAQLESFFREGLVRLYRAEAALDGPLAAPAPAAPEPEPEMTLPPHLQWSAVGPGGTIAAGVAEGGGAPQKSALPPEPPPSPEPPPPSEREVIDSPELRLAPRYIPRRQIGGMYNDIRFTLVQ